MRHISLNPNSVIVVDMQTAICCNDNLVIIKLEGGGAIHIRGLGQRLFCEENLLLIG